jgi:purine-binding chemotaxis protein CheW
MTAGNAHKETVTIDWHAIRQRMAASAAALAAGAQPTSADVERILKARAQTLARAPRAERKAGEDIEYLEFALADERYGLETVHIREVAPFVALTPLPCVPPFVLGITNLHGQVLALIDLKKFFELPKRGLTNLNRIIVLEDNRMALGILADAIIGVRSCSSSELQASLPTMSGVRENYLRGIGPDRVAILDAQKVLGDERIIVHEEVKG